MKKIVGLFVFMLLIGTVLTVVGQRDNEKIVYENRMDGNVFDKVKVRCRGPDIWAITSRTNVVDITIINIDYEVAYTYRIKASVSKLNGELIFGPINDYHKIDSNKEFHYIIAPFYSFEKDNHLFGFFKVDVELEVYHNNDSSTKQCTFTGFIFVISAIIIPW